uniref:Uncharacterized protein n=2 Tax=Zea mays TaxID=4577 RepID=A0A804LXZ9_MAIZE
MRARGRAGREWARACRARRQTGVSTARRVCPRRAWPRSGCVRIPWVWAPVPAPGRLPAQLLFYRCPAVGKTVDKGTPGDSIDTKPMSNLGKRKRYMTDEDVAVFNGMKEAVSDVAAAVRESIHAEAAPGIYNVVINCPGFSRETLMYALNHMMEHKATSLVFLDMTPDDRDLWLKTFLAKH